MSVRFTSGLAALALAAGLAAQEGATPPAPLPLGQDDPQQELIELVQKVELRLIAIDRRLGDASTGSTPLGEVEESGIDDLLKGAVRDGQRTLEDIDRILEIARQMGAQQGSSGSQQQSEQPQGGDSPLDAERDRGPQERENTPSEPGAPEDTQGEQPGEEPGGTQPDQPSGEEPDRPGGENRQGRPQGEQAGSGPSAADDANRWGELPVRYREVFRNQGGEELPVQYREWIDAYHRRLSKSRP